MTTVTATVPKSTNHVWKCKGKVISIDLQTGIVFLTMLTGEQVGATGGFNLDEVRFHVTRTIEHN